MNCMCLLVWELFLCVRNHSALPQVLLRSKALSGNSATSENEEESGSTFRCD